MKKPPLATNELYHIYNRGVEKRIIFNDNRDYNRFLRILHEFNTIDKRVLNVGRRITEKPLIEVEPQSTSLVEILAFCLMPNHYHLLVRQKEDNGIARFMQKLGTGYTMYFNTRHERVGSLFQGRFRAVHIADHNHILYLPHYIHLNPLDLQEPQWQQQGSRNHHKALDFIENYRWSSCRAYTKQMDSIPFLQIKFILSLFGGKGAYKQDLEEWLKTRRVSEIKKILLE